MSSMSQIVGFEMLLGDAYRFAKRAVFWAVLVACLPLLLPSISIASLIGLAIFFQFAVGALGVALLQALFSAYFTAHPCAANVSQHQIKVSAPDFDAYLLLKQATHRISCMESSHQGEYDVFMERGYELDDPDEGDGSALDLKEQARVSTQRQRDELGDVESHESGLDFRGDHPHEVGQQVLDSSQETGFEEGGTLGAEFPQPLRQEGIFCEQPADLHSSSSDDIEEDNAAFSLLPDSRLDYTQGSTGYDGSGLLQNRQEPALSPRQSGTAEMMVSGAAAAGNLSCPRVREPRFPKLGEMEAQQCMKVVEFCLSQAEDYHYECGSSSCKDYVSNDDDRNAATAAKDDFEEVDRDTMLQEVISLRMSSSSSSGECSSSDQPKLEAASSSTLQNLENYLLATPGSSHLFRDDGSGTSCVSTPRSSIGDNNVVVASTSGNSGRRRSYGGSRSVEKGLRSFDAHEQLRQALRRLRCSQSASKRFEELLSSSSASSTNSSREDIDMELSTISRFQQLLSFWRERERGLEIQRRRKNLFGGPAGAASHTES